MFVVFQQDKKTLQISDFTRVDFFIMLYILIPLTPIYCDILSQLHLVSITEIATYPCHTDFVKTDSNSVARCTHSQDWFDCFHSDDTNECFSLLYLHYLVLYTRTAPQRILCQKSMKFTSQHFRSHNTSYLTRTFYLWPSKTRCVWTSHR